MTATPGIETAGDLVIDDLRFEDLLRIALQDMPGASQGRWTVHGAVDPGITFLELFAWQLEQRLFAAEQLTDPVVRASLRLLGVPDPAPTRSARTVLCFLPLPAPVELPAGTLMSLERDALGRAYTLDEPAVVLPIGQIEAAGRLQVAGDVLELIHRYAGPRLSNQPVRLLVDLVAAPGVPPGWSPAAVEVPPAATLQWTAVGPDGSEAAVTVTDGTGGFRRSGLLELAWPPVWNAFGAGPCQLRVRAVRASYTEAVQLRRIYANAVRATHREARQDEVGAKLGALLPLPGQRLPLMNTAGALLDGPGQVSLRLTELDGVEHVWTSVADWSQVGPGDRVLVVDRTRGELVFGDGRAGRIPRIAPGAPATVTYATGGGPSGNIGAGSRWARAGGAELASNPMAAEGGADAQTLEAAVRQAAEDLATADRTVTASDAKDLVLATPGIGLERAHATVGLHPEFPCVGVPTALTVTAVPHAGRQAVSTDWTKAPVPDSGALAAARAQLGGRRLIGQEVFVLPPVYRRVSVWVTVSQTARGEALETRIKDALIRYLDPLRGGSSGDGWPFGGVVRPSALIGVVRSVLGPEADVASLSVALDDEPATDCADLVIGARELVWLDDVQTTWLTAVPAGGGLR
jgi:hypothetical protein